jgi:hypothetical protein
MKKIDLFYGVIIGFLATFLGTYIFFTFFSDYDYLEGISGMKSYGYLGKVITLGAAMNLIAFFVLLKRNKELMARGVVLATIILAFITIFV